MDETIRLPENWKGWTVTERIGSGSYGNVYKAEYTGADPSAAERAAAVKIIRIPAGKAEEAALAGELPDRADQIRYYENVIEGLLAEIRAMETLRKNPNVVKLQDSCVEHPDGSMQWTIYIRMELLTPLPDYMITRQMTEREILRLGLAVCNALEECEAHGILHRDIKPENIMVSDEGVYKLGDFGVARQMDLTTGSLSLKGTFTYMAPEVYHGEKYDAKADQYSLGIVLYRLLNRNRDPFLNPDARVVYYKDRESALQKRMKGEILPAPADASAQAAAVILKACAYRKEDRYARITDFKDALLICTGAKSGRVIAQSKADREEKTEISAEAKTGSRKKIVLPVLIGAAAAVVLIALVLSGAFGGGQKRADDGQSAAKSSTQSGAGSTENAVQDDTERTVPENTMSAAEGTADTEASSADTGEAAAETEEPVRESGTCGDALIWEIAGDTLTIRGTGTMEKYNIISSPPPWSNLEFVRIVVEEGVTGISDYAFYECRQVSEIQLPDSLISIGNTATNCYHLKHIFIPKNVNRIGTDFLTLSSELASITVDKENAFYDSRQDCNAIIETATNTLINGCQNTEIPDTVTAIGPGAFQNCYYLTKIYIPDSVVLIDSTAFEGRKDALTLCGSAGSEAQRYAEANGFAFVEMEASERNRIAEENTYNGTCGENLSWEVKGGTLRIRGTGKMDTYPQTNAYNNNSPWGGLVFQSVILEEGVTGISEYAFDLEMMVSGVELPESLERIEKGAFRTCEIPSVAIPKNVNHIGTEAFDPASLRFIKVDRENSWYDSREGCNAVIETQTDKLIIGCKNTVIPDSVTEIGMLAFYGCSDLKEITIPKNVEKIGAAAFSGCFQMETISVDEENTRFDSREGCNAIIETATNTLVTGCANTVIPESVTAIGPYAFCYCWPYTSDSPEITIPDSVVSIDEDAFAGWPAELVICGSAGSAAETYAKEKGIAFRAV